MTQLHGARSGHLLRSGRSDNCADLNAFSFWMTAFGGLLLYFSLVGANGLYGADNAPDVGWFAYAPLTSQTFSVGHSTDFWILALLVSGFGSIGTAVNIIATVLCMRC